MQSIALRIAVYVGVVAAALIGAGPTSAHVFAGGPSMSALTTGAPTLVVPSSVVGETVPVYGTASPRATVLVSDAGVQIAALSVDSTGAYAGTLSLAYGSHVLTATEVEADGTVGASSAAMNVLVVPTAPTILSPMDGSSTASSSVEITGTWAAGGVVFVSENGVTIASLAVDATGRFDGLATVGFGQHVFVLTATLVDPSGIVTSSDPVTLHVDVRVPPPVLSAPLDGSSTASPLVEFAGTATPGSTVTISDSVGDTTQTFTVAASPSGGAFDGEFPVGYGSHTFEVTQTVLDQSSGTASTSAPVTVHVEVRDPTPPVIVPSVTGDVGDGGWYTGDVRVTWTVTDPESAITSTSGCDAVPVSSDTAGQDVTCTATSAGGTASKTVSVHRDATPPTITATPDQNPNANGWYDSNVVVNFACSDAVSGIASCPAAVTLGEGKAQTITRSAKDVAGNIASTTLAGINVDETPPVVSYTGNAGSYTVDQTVTIACTASDALSGVASSTCMPVSGPAWSFGLGTTTRSADASDLAGNVGSASTSFTVEITCSALETLVGRFVSDAGVAASLSAKVASICSAANVNAKNGKIGAFDNELAAQTGKSVSAADADLLKRLAAAL